MKCSHFERNLLLMMMMMIKKIIRTGDKSALGAAAPATIYLRGLSLKSSQVG